MLKKLKKQYFNFLHNWYVMRKSDNLQYNAD